jgi:hypothetical protein
MKSSWLTSRYPLLESVLALAMVSFALLAMVWPNWLESFGVRLDYGNGALEWAVPIAMALIALVFSVRVGRRWRVDFARAIRARG